MTACAPPSAPPAIHKYYGSGPGGSGPTEEEIAKIVKTTIQDGIVHTPGEKLKICDVEIKMSPTRKCLIDPDKTAPYAPNDMAPKWIPGSTNILTGLGWSGGGGETFMVDNRADVFSITGGTDNAFRGRTFEITTDCYTSFELFQHLGMSERPLTNREADILVVPMWQLSDASGIIHPWNNTSGGQVSRAGNYHPENFTFDNGVAGNDPFFTNEFRDDYEDMGLRHVWMPDGTAFPPGTYTFETALRNDTAQELLPVQDPDRAQPPGEAHPRPSGWWSTRSEFQVFYYSCSVSC